MSKEFYKMQLISCEAGLVVHNHIYVSIHETPMMHFCVNKYNAKSLCGPLMREGETKLQAAYRIGIKVRRIHKNGSRIAFETREHALKHLRWMKQRQINHMKRQIEFNKAFLDRVAEQSDLQLHWASDSEYYGVPNTHELVHNHFIFD